MKRSLALLVFLAATSQSVAAIEPIPGQFDSRMRTATYNPDQVYRLTGFAGFHAVVTMGDDESISHVFGFDKAWEIVHTPNRVMIRPTIEYADSNLTVLTDKRMYVFDLTVRPFPKDEKVSQANDPQQTYALRFLYPTDDGEKLERKAAAEVAAKAKAEASGDNATKRLNRNYTYQGDEKIRPFDVWDDGTFTYFRFAKGQSIPAFFLIEDDGTEAAANKFLQGDNADTVVVKQTAGQFILRYGQTVVCIYNETARPTRMRGTERTSESGLMRLLKSTDNEK